MKNTKNIYLKTKDFFLSQEEYALHLNKEKDILITERSKQPIEKYYESNEYLSHKKAPKNLLGYAYRIVKALMLYKKWNIIKLYNSFGSVLDVGCGTGDFLCYLKKKGWQTVGVETNGRARDIAIQSGVEVLRMMPKNQLFSVITMWHVLEHLRSPKDTLLSLKNLLEEGGVLVIAVPNYNSYDAQYYKKYWAGYDVPRHLFHFSKKGLSRILKETGFEVLKIKPMFFDAFYVSLLSEKYRKGKMSFFNALKIGLVSNVSAFFSKEYSANIFVVRKDIELP